MNDWLKELSETAWRNTVVDLAGTLGWRVYYVENSTREIDTKTRGRVRVRNVNARGVGFPDLVLVRRGRLIFAELKLNLGPHGGGEKRHVNPTPAQNEWLDDLRTVENAIADRFVRRLAADADAECEPVEVFVWRPSMYDAIVQELEAEL